MKLIEIVSEDKARLFDALVKKEDEIRSRGRGTFFRTRPLRKNSATWKHKAYPGRVQLKRTASALVTAQIRTSDRTREWQMLSAFLGFVDRHFGDRISTITIRYR